MCVVPVHSSGVKARKVISASQQSAVTVARQIFGRLAERQDYERWCFSRMQIRSSWFTLTGSRVRLVEIYEDDAHLLFGRLMFSGFVLNVNRMCVSFWSPQSQLRVIQSVRYVAEWALCGCDIRAQSCQSTNDVIASRLGRAMTSLHRYRWAQVSGEDEDLRRDFRIPLCTRPGSKWSVLKRSSVHVQECPLTCFSIESFAIDAGASLHQH